MAAHIGKGPHQTGAQCDPKGIKSGLAGKVRRQIHVLLNGIVHGVIEGPPRHQRDQQRGDQKQRGGRTHKPSQKLRIQRGKGGGGQGGEQDTGPDRGGRQIDAAGQQTPQRSGEHIPPTQVEHQTKTQRPGKRCEKLHDHSPIPPISKKALIKPIASAPAHSSVSMSRMAPEMGEPTMVSRTALVMARPGISSMMSPIRILSAWSSGRKKAHRVMLMPTARAESRLNTKRLGH